MKKSQEQYNEHQHQQFNQENFKLDNHKNDKQNQQKPIQVKQEMMQRKSQSKKINPFKLGISKHIKNLDISICHQKTKFCQHSYGCIQSILGQTIQIFINGYFIKTGMSLALGFKKILSNPSKIGSVIISKDSINFGLFLGSFLGIYKGIRCFLRRHLPQDKHKYISLVAGLFAGGFSFIFLEKKSRKTYAIFLLIRVLDVTYNILVKKGILPQFKYFYVLVFCIMMGITGHAFGTQPGCMTPQTNRFYLSFLNEPVSQQQLREIWIEKKNNELMKYGIPRQNPLDYMPVLKKFYSSRK